MEDDAGIFWLHSLKGEKKQQEVKKGSLSFQGFFCLIFSFLQRRFIHR